MVRNLIAELVLVFVARVSIGGISWAGSEAVATGQDTYKVKGEVGNIANHDSEGRPHLPLHRQGTPQLRRGALSCKNSCSVVNIEFACIIPGKLNTYGSWLTWARYRNPVRSGR